MQIHELTQKKISSPIMEAGIMDYIRSMVTQDPSLAGLSIPQKAHEIELKGIAKNLANKAQNAWRSFAHRLRSVAPDQIKFDDRSDGVYQSNLRAFVQKNLLANMDPRKITNMAQIEGVLGAISAEANQADNKQTPLWLQLANLVSLSMIAATGPDSRLGDAAQQFKTALGGATNTDLPSIRTWLATNRPTITGRLLSDAIDSIAEELDNQGITVAGYSSGRGGTDANIGIDLGRLAKSTPTTLQKTGVPAVDDFLKTLGFTIRP